jgi:hypothetical protein
LSSLTKKIRGTKILKFQIPKNKYQTNYNDQNSKSQCFGHWELRFICNLVIEIWDLINFISEKVG